MASRIANICIARTKQMVSSGIQGSRKDKGGKDAGPIVAALGVAVLGWALIAVATLKAKELA